MGPFRVFSLVVAIFGQGRCRGGWVDPDSTELEVESLSTGAALQLVYSDEFEVDGRSFADGADPRWTALTKNDYTNDALHYYSSNRATTHRGFLNISTIAQDVTFPVYKDGGVQKLTKNFQTAMLQGWNKFCFVGGAIEISAKLPGKGDVGGLWPALWLMGNLARSTYVSSSQNIWPWSYNTCNRQEQGGQEISACNAVNHFDMHPYQGRGSPEVDILEAMMGKGSSVNTATSRPYYSASLQVSPALAYSHPDLGRPPQTTWYHKGIEYGRDTSLNVFFYGSNLGEGVSAYSTDTLSANRNLNSSKFDAFHLYRLEWESGDAGYLKWYFDNELVYSIDAATLKLTGAIIPEEPMYVILNTALSSTWGFPTGCPDACYDCKRPECGCALGEGFCDMLPAEFLIDYVRVYQDPQDPAQMIGCSPSSHPTAKFIEGHKQRYMSETDESPLKDISHGGGFCNSNLDCAGKKTSPNANQPENDSGVDLSGGSCLNHKCKCPPHLVGPNCLAYNAFDQVSYSDSDDDWDMNPADVNFYVPTSLNFFFISAVIASAVAFYGKYRSNTLRGSRELYGFVSHDTDDS